MSTGEILIRALKFYWPVVIAVIVMVAAAIALVTYLGNRSESIRYELEDAGLWSER